MISTSDDSMPVEDIALGYKQKLKIERVFNGKSHSGPITVNSKEKGHRETPEAPFFTLYISYDCPCLGTESLSLLLSHCTGV